MKKYSFTLKEYSSISKKKVEKEYSTIAENEKEAIDSFYRTWGFKWTKEEIGGFLNGN